jgi:hypothetical protein
VLRQEPALARDLRIGRPDLPRHYDDGGLVDVNNVPEHVLTTALGITRDEARRIVAERQRTGGFTSVDEIAARGLLPKAVVGRSEMGSSPSAERRRASVRMPGHHDARRDGHARTAPFPTPNH